MPKFGVNSCGFLSPSCLERNRVERDRVVVGHQVVATVGASENGHDTLNELASPTAPEMNGTSVTRALIVHSGLVGAVAASTGLTLISMTSPSSSFSVSYTLSASKSWKKSMSMLPVDQPAKALDVAGGAERRNVHLGADGGDADAPSVGRHVLVGRAGLRVLDRDDRVLDDVLSHRSSSKGGWVFEFPVPSEVVALLRSGVLSGCVVECSSSALGWGVLPVVESDHGPCREGGARGRVLGLDPTGAGPRSRSAAPEERGPARRR